MSENSLIRTLRTLPLRCLGSGSDATLSSRGDRRCQRLSPGLYGGADGFVDRRLTFQERQEIRPCQAVEFRGSRGSDGRSAGGVCEDSHLTKKVSIGEGIDPTFILSYFE